MPGRPRVFVEGGIYHVYNRFARGADLFSEPEEAIAFLEILRNAGDRDGLTGFWDHSRGGRGSRKGTLDQPTSLPDHGSCD